jgi:FkbM family methyltransferase
MKRAVVHVLSLVQPRKGYEDSFRSAMLACIRPGDCVWDVGANIGLYSELFAVAAGNSGKVISFEPSHACVAILKERLRGRASGASWEIVPAALSDKDGEARFSVVDGDTAPSNHLARSDEASTVPVQVVRGDALVAAGYEVPAVVKIDVEGFEGEVLDGMGTVLEDPSLRAVCVEIHFQMLTERGRPREPTRIARLLEGHGFIVEWVDMSHLIARR